MCIIVCIFNCLFMTKIISATELVRGFSEFSKSLNEHALVATKNGRGHIVVLPYYDGCDKKIVEYMEDYEMFLNKKNLEVVYHESLKSGESDLII